MNRFKYILLITNLFSMVAVIYLLTGNDNSKSAYFLSATVYNEFEYKKELEAELEHSRIAGQSRLDSLEYDLKTAIALMKSTTPTPHELELLQHKQNSYIDYRDRVERDYTAKVEECYALIWDRINGYVNEYGEQKGYQYIFGANGDGSIMYADASSNITAEITAYINQRYEGE